MYVVPSFFCLSFKAVKSIIQYSTIQAASGLMQLTVIRKIRNYFISTLALDNHAGFLANMMNLLITKCMKNLRLLRKLLQQEQTDYI